MRGVRGDAAARRRDARAVRAVPARVNPPPAASSAEVGSTPAAAGRRSARPPRVGRRAGEIRGRRAVRWVSVDVGVRGGVDGGAVRGAAGR